MITGSLARPGGQLYFDRLGTGQDMLLLHAGGERRRVWHPAMADLAQHDCCTHAYDQRGHGESTSAHASALPIFGQDAAAMLAPLVAPMVVGASLGGFAALVALADPQVEARVAGLVLVDVLPDPDPEGTLRYLTPRGMATSPLVADILGRRDQLRDIAAGLTLPILVVRAGDGAGITDGDVARFLTLAPQARFATVPGAGHLVAREKPHALAALLAAFAQSDAVLARRSETTSSLHLAAIL